MPPTSDTAAGQPGSDAIQLAEENLRLSEENRRLKAEQRRRELTLFLSELRLSGRLTPAMEHAGLEEALLAAEAQALEVYFADGRHAPLSEVLSDVLRAAPAAFGSGVAAEPESSQAPVLSEDELRIARALGLSEEEFASIRSAG